MNKSYLKSKSFLLPLLLWLGFLLVMFAGFKIGKSRYDSIVPALIIWDAEHYLSIARDGYEVFPCDWNPRAVCGNVGWFPFYPMVGKILGWAGIDHRYGLLGLSWLSLLGAMLLLYRLVEDRFGGRSAAVSLAALLAFPTAFYFLSAFPYSLYLLLAVSVLYLLEKKPRWLVVPLSGFLTVTYPSGAVIGIPLLYLLATNFKKFTKRSRVVLVASLAAIGVAMFIYFGYNWLEFGDFFLYLKIHSQYYYAHSMAIPFVVFYEVLTELSPSSPVFIMVVFIAAALLLFYNRRLPVTWQIFMWGVLLFTPTMGTCDCWYRHIVVAFPFAIMIGTAIDSSWRRYLLIPYFIVSLWLSWSVYLTMYKVGQLM